MIKKTALAVIILSLGISRLSATMLKGQLVTTDAKLPSVIFLQSYYNRNEADTIKIGPYGDFSFQITANAPAMYSLRVSHGAYPFFVSPYSDEVIRITLTITDGNISKADMDETSENNAFTDFDKFIRTYDGDLVEMLKHNEPDTAIAGLIRDYNNEISSFEDFYKGTYTAKIAEMRRIKVDKHLSGLENLRRNFLANLSFKDTAILGNPVAMNMLSFYYGFIADTSFKARMQFTDDLMKRLHANPIVYKTFVTDLYNVYQSDLNEDLMWAMMQWFDHSADTALFPVLRAKMNALKTVMPGQKFAEVSYADENGAIQALSNTVKASKYTLLVFWESTCSHCRQTIPLVKELYNRFHEKGLEVYACSMDENESDWKKYKTDNQLQWVNVHATGNKEEILARYYVSYFPTLILIDQKGTIVHRLTDVKQINKTLEQKL